jgi:hypothetical protein
MIKTTRDESLPPLTFGSTCEGLKIEASIDCSVLGTDTLMEATWTTLGMGTSDKCMNLILYCLGLNLMMNHRRSHSKTSESQVKRMNLPKGDMDLGLEVRVADITAKSKSAGNSPQREKNGESEPHSTEYYVNPYQSVPHRQLILLILL